MALQITRAAEGESVDRSSMEIFEGGAVHGRSLVEAEAGAHLTAAIVQFSSGARTRMHRHSSDQLLYVVSGIGQVGDADGDHVISNGDVILIPAGEAHWHGAGDTTSPMSHLTVMRGDSETTIV